MNNMGLETIMNIDNGTMVKIFIIGIGAMFILMGIVLLIKNLGKQTELGSISGTIPALIILITGIGIILASQVINIPEIEPMTEVRSKSEIYTEAVNNGYTVYVDGTEVDPHKLDVNNYKMTVDDENRNIQLATSTDDSRKHLISLVLVFVPLLMALTLFKK